jgi:iron uptake system EfeUOB component EfeO/EfeM
MFFKEKESDTFHSMNILIKKYKTKSSYNYINKLGIVSYN